RDWTRCHRPRAKRVGYHPTGMLRNPCWIGRLEESCESDLSPIPFPNEKGCLLTKVDVLRQLQSQTQEEIASFGHLIIASCAGAFIAALCRDIVGAPRSESVALRCCMARIET